jgi:hypothetical protein
MLGASRDDAMINEHQMLQRDLKILEQMAMEMEAYLIGDSIHWTLAERDMPRLTIGGYLMRQQRLPILKNYLRPAEQAQLDVAIKHFNQTLVEKVVRFEQRAHQELHAFLSEWTCYLRGLTKYRALAVTRYASEVDTRVVITALINKLLETPYHLDPQIPSELTVLDRILRRHWQVGEFVWEPVWQLAYPIEKYWWLYGKPDLKTSSQAYSILTSVSE